MQEQAAAAKSLRDMAVGETGRVAGYAGGSPAYRRKLLSMGLTPGAEFRVLRRAPLGDPVEIHLRGYNLCLRRDEAAALLVRGSMR